MLHERNVWSVGKLVTGKMFLCAWQASVGRLSFPPQPVKESSKISIFFLMLRYSIPVAVISGPDMMIHWKSSVLLFVVLSIIICSWDNYCL